MCTQVVHRFFRALDEMRLEAAAQLFAPDGVWSRRGEPLTGREAILAALRARPATLWTRHLVTNLIVDIEPEGVTARYYVTVFAHEGPIDGAPPISAPHSILVCEDRLTRSALDWWFQRRRSEVAFKSI